MTCKALCPFQLKCIVVVDIDTKSENITDDICNRTKCDKCSQCNQQANKIEDIVIDTSRDHEMTGSDEKTATINNARTDRYVQDHQKDGISVSATKRSCEKRPWQQRP